MAEKAVEAEANSAEVEMPSKKEMEAEAPPPYNPPPQSGPEAQFQVNCFDSYVGNKNYLLHS